MTSLACVQAYVELLEDALRMALGAYVVHCVYFYCTKRLEHFGPLFQTKSQPGAEREVTLAVIAPNQDVWAVEGEK